MKKTTIICGLIAVLIALASTACEDPEPAHVHQWGAWNIITAANCTTTGSQTRTCTLDATHTETEIIPINDSHDWGEWEGTVTCTEGGTGTRVCSRNAMHIETNDNLQPLGHNYQNWTQTTAPTCTTTGVETGTCTRDNSHTTTRAGVAALGHNYRNWTQTTAPTCTTAGIETGTCTRDNSHTTTRAVPRDPTAHDYQWVTIAPSFIKEGVDKERCSRCTYESGNIFNTVPPLIITTAANWTTAMTQINGKTGSYALTIGGSFDIAGSINNTFGTTASTLTVTLKGSGTLSLSSNGNILRIGENQTIILDSENIILEGLSTNNTSLVYVLGSSYTNQNAKLELRNGTISGNNRSITSDGGGVYVCYGTFTMSGGTISGNTSASGGGVYVDNGTFTMNGGTISGNTSSSSSSSYAGGVYVDSGTFTMNGGKISGNTTSSSSSSSSSYGGGVYVTGSYGPHGTFIMNGGEISGNTTSSSYSYDGRGGGVYVNQYGTFTMSGGTISDNNRSISSDGGGVYVYFDGGGVYVYFGTFTMTGGEISGNVSSSSYSYGGRGGGVYVNSYGTFRIVTGTVYGLDAEEGLKNTAIDGAALYNDSGTAQLGTFNGTTWQSKGNLTTTENTIRAVNGELQ